MIRTFLARQLLGLAVRLWPPVGDVRPLPELVVVANARQATRMGFDLKTGRHREYGHLTLYWPGAGERRLRSKTFGRVTVDDFAGCVLTPAERDLIRSRTQMWGAKAAWLEL